MEQFTFTAAELTLTLEEYSRRYVRPAALELAARIRRGREVEFRRWLKYDLIRMARARRRAA